MCVWAEEGEPATQLLVRGLLALGLPMMATVFGCAGPIAAPRPQPFITSSSESAPPLGTASHREV